MDTAYRVCIILTLSQFCRTHPFSPKIEGELYVYCLIAMATPPLKI